MRAIDLEAIFARVTGTADDDGLASNLQFLEGIEHEFGTRQTQHLLNHTLRLRSLHCNLSVVFALVLGHYIEALRLLNDPGIILVDVGSVDDEEEAIVGFLIDQEVIDGATILVKHHAIEDLADGSTGNVVGENMLHKAFGLGTSNQHFAHMAHVKYATSRAYSDVLVGNIAILQWHHEATERNHFCIQTDVSVVETCFLIFHRL